MLEHPRKLRRAMQKRFIPEVEKLKDRLAPVVGGVNVLANPSPFNQTNYDGVAAIDLASNAPGGFSYNASGALFQDRQPQAGLGINAESGWAFGSHILTAAHVLDQGGTQEQYARFVMYRDNNANPNNRVVIRIKVPANNAAQNQLYQVIPAGFQQVADITQLNDIAVLKLVDQFQQQPDRLLVAPFTRNGTGLYNLHQGNAEVGQVVEFGGFGLGGGTGAAGYAPNTEGQKRAGRNQLDMTGMSARNALHLLTFSGNGNFVVGWANANQWSNPIPGRNANWGQVQTALAVLPGFQGVTVRSIPRVAGKWWISAPSRFEQLQLQNAPPNAAPVDYPIIIGQDPAAPSVGPNSSTLWMDHDSANPVNDAMAPYFGFAGAAAYGEALPAEGDSGGPVFVDNGVIGGVVSQGGSLAGFADSPPESNLRKDDSSYGEIFAATRVSSYMNNFIISAVRPLNPNGTEAKYHIVLDMNYQLFGKDGIREGITITAGRNGPNLELTVNNPNVPGYSGLYYSAPAANISGLTIRGSDDSETITVVGHLGVGAITVDAGGGNNRFVFDDSANAAPNVAYTVTGTTVQVGGGQVINYTGFQFLDALTGTANDIVNVRSTNSTTVSTIETGAANNVINIGSVAHTLDAIKGNLRITRFGGTATVFVNDQGGPVGTRYALPNPVAGTLTVTRPGANPPPIGRISYDVSSVIVKQAVPPAGGAALGNVANIEVNACSLAIEAGSNDDTVVFDLAPQQLGGSVVLDGQAGQDLAILSKGLVSTAQVSFLNWEDITVDGGGLAPGGLATAASFSIAGSYTQTSGTLFLDLGGAASDQLVVAGAVALGGYLNLGALADFSSAAGSITLLDKAGAAAVTGTFIGLPENAVVSVGGKTFQISYMGGSGNDVVLSPAKSLITLASSLNPSFKTQDITFTATVSAGGGDPPTGEVNFHDGATWIGVAALGAGGVANFVYGGLEAGDHIISASYGGSSVILIQSVFENATALSLTSSLNPSYWTQDVTFTATVAPSGSPLTGPTGIVNFFDNGNYLGNAPLNGSGAAIFVAANLGVGQHFIVAQYAGDSTFAAGSQNSLTRTVLANDSAVTVTAEIASMYYTEKNVTLTAAVAPAGGTPLAGLTGVVYFYDNGGYIGNDTVDGSGHASFVYGGAGVGVGNHSISVAYSGDSIFVGSSSTVSADFTVLQNDSAVSVTRDIGSMYYTEKNVTFTATVTPAGGTPLAGLTGVVYFYDNGGYIGNDTVDGSGHASFVYGGAGVGVGSHSISVAYSGDSIFVGSSSTVSADFTVLANQTSLALTSSLNPSPFGQSVTFTATIAPLNSPVTGPTGTVSFYDNGAYVGSAIVQDGTATLAYNSLSVGDHGIAAVYSGDTVFLDSQVYLTQQVFATG